MYIIYKVLFLLFFFFFFFLSSYFTYQLSASQ